MVQVYTGTGKGKTTAAIGLACRAIGRGLKVYMIQFLKGGWETGELKAIEERENFKIVQYGRKEFVDPSNPSKEDMDLAKKALDHAREVLKSGEWDMVILDELNVAINMGLVPLEEALQLIKEKPEEVELVITGRGAPKEIIEVADLVTEMREVKHYYRKGIPARKGIEY